MAPTQIGRFEIIAELGKHPLGMLYKANDPKRGHVALLAIESASLTPASRQLVQQLFGRARTATLLNSPNIASIFGGGEADGYVHLAMEFVDGVTLRTQMARDGKASSSELVDVARQLCTALDHAQSKAVVHQNLHPGNVKVEWDGAVKLMDYGLDIPGKHAAGDPAIAYAQRYASPEQLRGESITFKSNLYTLGAMLYELATGKKAIAVEEDERVRDQVLQGEVEPANKVCPDVPKVISDAIARAMNKNASERFESAVAFVRELENYRAVKKAPAPTVAPPDAPLPAAKPKPKTAYGGPNTSAIFRAMQDNFRQGPRPSNGGTAVAELAEQAPKTFEQTSGDDHFGPTHNSVMAVTPTPSGPRAQQSEMAPAVAQPAHREETPLPAQVLTDEAPDYESATLITAPQVSSAAPAASASRQMVAAEAARAVAKPRQATPAVRKPAGSKGRFQLPQRRKLVLIAAGMLVALTILWAVSQYFGSRAEAAQSNAFAKLPEESLPVDAQAEAATPQSAASEQPEVIVRQFDQKRRSKKPMQVATAEPAALTGEVVVTSIPEGAQIQIDGRADAQWVTPQTLTGIPVGEHTFTISRPGYTTIVKTLEIAANQRPVITVAMQQIAATLAVTSDPAGALVVLDGRDTGKLTPAQLSVSPGMHQVTLRKGGYFEHSSTANAPSNQTVSVNASLVLAGRTDDIQSVGKLGKLFGRGASPEMGKLRVRTEPKGAYITLNGKPAPDASPGEFLLNPGTYEVRMQLTGYAEIRRTVEIVKGKRIELDEVFAARR